MRSEVARLREQIQAEYQAAQRGLSGLARRVSNQREITGEPERRPFATLWATGSEAMQASPSMSRF